MMKREGVFYDEAGGVFYEEGVFYDKAGGGIL